eukprot:6112887-Alexandrium_andersonii.AAC.1
MREIGGAWDLAAVETWQAWAAEFWSGRAYDQLMLEAQADGHEAEQARSELWLRWCQGGEEALIDAAGSLARARGDTCNLQNCRGR